MVKSPALSICLISIIYFGCSKGKSTTPASVTSGIKIEIVSGNNQTDTIGKQLQAPLVVKVTKNGVPVKNSLVLFEGSGCNAERLDKFGTDSTGKVGYYWYLSGTVGGQTLTAVVLDAQNHKVDSVIAVSTGLAAGSGLHYSACVYPFGFPVAAFCKLSTGRLFTNFNSGNAYLRYSDDNGISWNSVKSLGNTHDFQYITSSTADEIFAFATDGNYYSADAGTTWTALPVQAFNTDQIKYAVCTRKGRLLVTTAQHSLYLSSDKGKTWTYANNGLGSTTLLSSVAEDKDGNLYATSHEIESLFKSTDAGNTWTVLIQGSGQEMDYDIFIDNNNWFYKARSDAYGGIFISKDNGSTYTLLINIPNTFVQNLSVQSDGNLYYSVLQQGLFMANGISSSVKAFDDNESIAATPYIVAKNNNIILGNPSTSIIKYYSK